MTLAERGRGAALPAGVLALLVVLGGCSAGPGRSSATSGGPSRSPTRSLGEPFHVGSRWQCPAGFRALVLPGERTYRPTNYPGVAQGATSRPDRCYVLTQEAEADGYRRAPTPPGDTLIDGVYLVPTTAAVHAECAAAARRLGFTVPCPGLLPTASRPAACTDGCLFGATFAFEFSGFLTPASTPEPTHAYLIGTPQPVAYLRQYCDPNATDSLAPLATSRIATVTCPSGSALNSGHVMVWSRRGPIAVAASVHGNTTPNTRLAQAIVERVDWTPP